MPAMVGIASLLVAPSVCARAAATELSDAAGSAGPVGASLTAGARFATSDADAGANNADDDGADREGAGGDDGAGGAITSLSAEPVGGTSFMN
ncbi:MAG: hypothetical protein ACXWJ8_02465 [Xanthobacteraceae bacterium]